MNKLQEKRNELVATREQMLKSFPKYLVDQVDDVSRLEATKKMLVDYRTQLHEKGATEAEIKRSLGYVNINHLITEVLTEANHIQRVNSAIAFIDYCIEENDKK